MHITKILNYLNMFVYFNSYGFQCICMNQNLLWQFLKIFGGQNFVSLYMGSGILFGCNTSLHSVV